MGSTLSSSSSLASVNMNQGREWIGWPQKSWMTWDQQLELFNTTFNVHIYLVKKYGTTSIPSYLSDASWAGAYFLPTACRNSSFDIHGKNSFHFGIYLSFAKNHTIYAWSSICQGAYGPLRPPNKSKIPLWMAVNLKLKKKCHIVAPDWLNVGMFVTFQFIFFFSVALILLVL